MRIVFVINTPGQAHLWRFPITLLKEKGHEILVLARNDGHTCELLNIHDIQFIVYGKSSRSASGKIAQLPSHFLNSFGIARKFKPRIIVGVGLVEAYLSLFLRVPCIIFEDTEDTPFLERAQWRYLAKTIITPSCFRKDFGKKQIRFEGFKELAYLHPNYFKPDPSIYDELKINEKDKYIILRFNSLDAVHDINKHNFSTSEQFRLAKELERYARVLISPEAPLPKELEKYRLSIPYHRIHHALYYASMYISDTGTMATEAAILGTPTIECSKSATHFGNFLDLEQNYGLLYTFGKADDAIAQAVNLIQTPNLKEQWAKKRQILLAEKVDVTKFFVNFISDYPEILGNNGE